MSINTIGEYMREETLRVDLRFKQIKDELRDERDTELQNLRDERDSELQKLRDERDTELKNLRYEMNFLSGGQNFTKTLLYTGSGYAYYKVPVKHGEKLVEGKVPETCAMAGLQAVCSGPDGCEYTDTEKCLVTPLSTDCGNPMFVSHNNHINIVIHNQTIHRRPLSNVLCNKADLTKCGLLEGLFNYMKNWLGSEYGKVGSIVIGNNHMAGPDKPLFAYCAKKLE